MKTGTGGCSISVLVMEGNEATFLNPGELWLNRLVSEFLCTGTVGSLLTKEGECVSPSRKCTPSMKDCFLAITPDPMCRLM